MKNSLLPALLLALAVPSSASAFQLTLSATEQKIEKGQVRNYPISKAWTLPAAGIAASKKHGKLSSQLSARLNQIERQVNARQPRPATFKNVKGTWIAADQNGWIFDRDGTKANILKAVKAGRNSAQVSFKVVKPQRSVQLLAQRGVLNYVTTGSSSYAGSPDFREKNILVGASKLDNFFIAPGHVFDFNNEIGQIDASTGFVKGFVISGGTLAKEDGGGICQVSTTIFRALYKAGLPIVERHDHSHRVKYYDPVGFEATVYAPDLNLKMKNDTGKYLFVQAGWDKAAQTLRFDVFGADTGRTVNISQPVITNFKAPPKKPTYTEDRRVALNSRRLLDQPMQGMTSVITRTIKVKGKTVSTHHLKSTYKPWAAVYGVNPRDKRLKQ